MQLVVGVVNDTDYVLWKEKGYLKGGLRHPKEYILVHQGRSLIFVFNFYKKRSLTYSDKVQLLQRSGPLLVTSTLSPYLWFVLTEIQSPRFTECTEWDRDKIEKSRTNWGFIGPTPRYVLPNLYRTVFPCKGCPPYHPWFESLSIPGRRNR